MLSMSGCDLGGYAWEGEWIAEAAASVNAAYANAHPYIAVFLCVTGTFMNVITVAVLTRPSMLSPVNVLLCAVAVCDILVMTSNLIFVSHFHIAAMTRCNLADYSHLWAIFLFIHSQATVVFHATSIWLTVLLAQIRVLTIRRATKAPTEALGIGATAVLAVVTLTIVMAVNIPNFLTFEIVEQGIDDDFVHCIARSVYEEEDRGGNELRQLTTSQEDDMIEDKIEVLKGDNLTIYNLKANDDCALLKLSFWSNGLLFKVVPCALLTVSIVALLKIIADVADRRRSLAQVMNKKRMPRDHTTPMLVAVLSIFLVTELPQGILHLCNAIYTRETFFKKVTVNLGDMMDLLSLINSGVNFIIYCAMSRKFRIVFLQLVSPCLPQFIVMKLQDHFSGGEFEVSRSHRPSAITDLTRTEQLALASHRSSATSVLLRAPSTENLSRIYGPDSLLNVRSTEQKSSLLTVPGPNNMTPRVSFDDRTKNFDGRNSLEIHELRLVVPQQHNASSIFSFLSALRPSRIRRSIRRMIRRTSNVDIGITIDGEKEDKDISEMTPAISSPERRLNMLQIEFNYPSGY